MIKQNLQKVNNSKSIEDGDICIVYGMNDEKLTLLSTENGKEFDIYISASDKMNDNICNQGEHSNTYKISKNDLYKLDLGSKLIIKNGNFEVYDGPIDIKDDEAWYKLDELYGALKDDESKNFIVKEIKDKKIIITYEDGGGYISRYKEAYPDFKPGDVVKRINGKFTRD